MTEEVRGVALTDIPTNSQRLFIRYLMATLIDLTVINLFDEYWASVSIGSFSISILAAIPLLGAINFAFGDGVSFTGPLHGVVAFICVVLAMLAAEEITIRIYRRLASEDYTGAAA